ncbi:MAG: hypothetical protein A3D31_05655 [Candidatus Fluviicola riflensis]|nr:MAG: hypothetical protein CHH17_09360 [Candidatus Fluviicola riflensis]OGS79454.1 MAG: hypothetical protein A3D31_05655 [Candidatus Fluviicola riflensis]OGS86885.1 MAG: hypothetical protein A2724_05115 [Fluviicola sp. RIFCSPHIGHO2_01_FULL_43_53]OGS89676.1 MAG: hypothetical protein A3E30_01860 [Fluviicola sp. RIFCSPHIGHO2_12_FULL_43_24]
MTQTQLSMLAKWTFWATFLIATYIMARYYFTSDSVYVAAGLLFIVAAFIANLSVMIAIRYHRLKNETLKRPKSIRLLFLNIPIGLFYLWFAVWLNGCYRVTIVNDTQMAVHHIRISGCDNAEKALLKPGESKTFWISIPTDCELRIRFIDHHNNLKKGIVAGYLTNGMGQTDEYHISGKNNSNH